MVFSVRLSHLFDYVPIIVSSWYFQELSPRTRVRSMQKVKVRGQRSRSKGSRPNFPFRDCNSSLNSHMMMKWYWDRTLSVRSSRKPESEDLEPYPRPADIPNSGPGSLDFDQLKQSNDKRYDHIISYRYRYNRSSTSNIRSWSIVPNAFFSCDHAALWMVFSVRLSHLFDYVPIIVSSWYFQELSPRTRVRSMQKVKVKGQGHRGYDPTFRFRTVTLVWIHIWWWNDTYSWMLLRRGALLFFKVIRQISRSHGAKNHRIWPRLGVSGL